MYDQTECVFCFEKFQQENLLLNKVDFNKYIVYFLNKVLELDCGHIFHLGCFSKYIKIKMKKMDQIECPFCRKKISNVKLIKLLQDLNNITYIKNKIWSKLIKLNIKISLQKCHLYYKGFFNLSNNLDEIIEYYEELSFSYTKINYMSKNIKTICDNLTKLI
jgi:hypothetical protein